MHPSKGHQNDTIINALIGMEIKFEPVKREHKKIGRNEKVTITDGKESKVIKYKKAQSLLENGWTLVEQ